MKSRMGKANNIQEIEDKFMKLTKEILDAGGDINVLKTLSLKKERTGLRLFYLFLPIITALSIVYWNEIKWSVLGTRCFVPNSYFIWEATRPLSDCTYCANISKAIVIQNCTAQEFDKYAYTSQPVIIKNAVKHWKAMEVFDFKFFKDLYDSIEGAYEVTGDNCQFLPFQSNFNSLYDVLHMSESRAQNLHSEKPWYVGWENCHPQVLEQLRRYYPKPHFLPNDSENSGSDNIFMGYNPGATMHLDFISKLMWQAQLKGNKTWYLAPTPDCEEACKPVTFYVEPGDAVLLDTRVWYHGTSVAPGEFSLTVQSEYG